MNRIWEVKKVSEEAVKKISEITGLSVITSRILAARGFTEENDIKSFFNPDFINFKDPNLLKDIKKASIRIFQACTKNEKICIYGDYDADGITSTSILYQFLQESEADVNFYIPDRKKDGYGLKTEFVERTDYDLIITVDNGITSFDAVEAAKKKGIDVVITDHHDVNGQIPEACAVVDPKREDCDSGMEYLAGVGVTYCLIIVLRQLFREKGFYRNRKEPNLKILCDLVAIGTVADIVPLVNENRILVKYGFEVMKSSGRLGLNSLFKVCNLKANIRNADDIGFKIAPKINAAGRMDNASICVDLLTTNDKKKADEISKRLLLLNSERQNLEKETETQIIEILNNDPGIKDKNVIVLSSPNWDSGVLGIVASKIVSKFYKPVVLFEETGKISKGSGRSIEGLNMCEGFKYADKSILFFGGHKMAAGLSVETVKIKEFESLFNEYAGSVFKKKKPEQKYSIDCEIDLSDIDEKLLNELDSLEPCGNMNLSPLFKSDKIEIINVKKVGGLHSKLKLKDKNGLKNRIFDGIIFNNIDIEGKIKNFESIVFSLKWNYWNGSRSIQIVIEDYRIRDCEDTI